MAKLFPDRSPVSDQLKGIYSQAVERQNFPVAFVRFEVSRTSHG
jgi:hypothetical protein